MNAYKEDDQPSCCFHPTQRLIGVCPLCLNERLLVLASNQLHTHSYHHQFANQGLKPSKRRTPSISLPKIFAFGSLINRNSKRDHSADDPINRNSKRDHSADDPTTSTSQEDSFISIKFEDNGIALWDKSYSKPWNQNSSKEHRKLHGSLIWQKRIRHFFGSGK